MDRESTDTIFVTGGAGFIGSNFVLHWLKHYARKVVNLDKLTYAGNLGNLAEVMANPLHVFVHGGVEDQNLVAQLLERHRPNAIINFAAESHVDRSIIGPADFISTNVVGTFQLLEASRIYWQRLSEPSRAQFRFLHVSTDEVFGSLNASDAPACERTAYAPNSPYAASKAAADHLVRAYHHTYGIPVLTTNCSNNYGPYQFPEKLVPLMILRASKGESLPLYGDGLNIRDWLYVIDHCEAICNVLRHGRPGETFNIGANNELTNLDVVNAICIALAERYQSVTGRTVAERTADYLSLITFVKDRPGHDRRYAIDASKIRKEVGWAPRTSFMAGIRSTVAWYLDNPDWVDDVTSGEYRNWLDRNYGGRIVG